MVASSRRPELASGHQPKMADEADGNSNFVRTLANCDKKTRERGLAALSLWLSRRTEVGGGPP